METRDGTAQRMVPDLRQAEARAYRRGVRRRRLLRGALTTVVLACGALAGDDLADRLDAGPAPVTGVLVVLVLGTLLELVGLPVASAGWRASRRAGLSRQTARSWAADRVKGLVIAAALGLPAVGLLVWAQARWPDGWAVAAWAASLALSVVVAVLFPVLLLPLFLRSERLADGPLRRSVDALVARSGLRVRDVRLLRMGAKTSASNAAVTGIGPTRRILLGDTLVGLDGSGVDGAVTGHRLAEAEAVLAHELAHHRHGDIWRGLALEAATGLVLWTVGGAVLEALPAAVAHGGAGDPAALPALALVLGLLAVPLDIVGAWHSRRRERAADRYAVALADPEAFARGFERLVAANLAELEPPRLERLLASHPPPAARIDAARRAARRDPHGSGRATGTGPTARRSTGAGDPAR